MDWLFSKLTAFDVHALINDFDLHKTSTQVHLLRHALHLSSRDIARQPLLLFTALSSRLLSHYGHQPRLRALIDQADQHALRLNPLIPLAQTAPSSDALRLPPISLGLHLNQPVYLQLLASPFYGRVLAVKNAGNAHTSFFDLDLRELLPAVATSLGQPHCSINAEFLCYIEDANRFVDLDFFQKDTHACMISHSRYFWNFSEKADVFFSIFKYVGHRILLVIELFYLFVKLFL
jgi:hypothetical protein